MLRAYQYIETDFETERIQTSNLRAKEREIARQYVYAHGRHTVIDKECPVCGEAHGKYFFTKWEMDYLLCPACKSVYADIDGEIAENYQKHEPLLRLRLSTVYQDESSESRAEMWKDFLEWVSMRSFRFLKKNEGLHVVDVGNRFAGYSKMIREAKFCGRYDLRDSILREDEESIPKGTADIVLYLDQMQKETNPAGKARDIATLLRQGGLLVLGTRAGSGFDILTLKGYNKKIFPYEHIMLPSVKGLTGLLEDNGFKVLEVTTPGVMDVKYVMDSMEDIDEGEGFVRYLLEESSMGLLQEFQRFLQKGCMSSFVRVVACRA